MSIELVKRDIRILKLIYSFRFCLSRHILFLAPFDGSRACDRRLKKLVDSGYLKRQKILYGIPYLYYLSTSGMRLIHVSPKEEKIRIDQIHHDITVLDCIPNLIKEYDFDIENIITERQLHMQDGFGTRKHHPDLVVQKENETYAFEIELNLKSKNRLEQNIEQNYLTYDKQIWVVPLTQPKILNILTQSANMYDNIEVITLESLLS